MENAFPFSRAKSLRPHRSVANEWVDQVALLVDASSLYFGESLATSAGRTTLDGLSRAESRVLRLSRLSPLPFTFERHPCAAERATRRGCDTTRNAIRVSGGEGAHGGFVGSCKHPVALSSEVGLFRGPDGQMMNACLPLYLCESHFARVRVQIKPILGFFKVFEPISADVDRTQTCFLGGVRFVSRAWHMSCTVDMDMDFYSDCDIEIDVCIACAYSIDNGCGIGINLVFDSDIDIDTVIDIDIDNESDIDCDCDCDGHFDVSSGSGTDRNG